MEIRTFSDEVQIREFKSCAPILKQKGKYKEKEQSNMWLKIIQFPSFELSKSCFIV
jgi:hypothetical protein